MFRSWRSKLLEAEIDRATRELKNHAIGSEEYVKTLDQIVKLHRMVEEEKSSSVSKDTLVSAGTNLLGIILILAHEWTGPITSKALGFIIRPRV
jgi:hypothetical protein